MAENGLEGWKKEEEEVKKKKKKKGESEVEAWPLSPPWCALLAFSNRLRSINAETKGGWARNN